MSNKLIFILLTTIVVAIDVVGDYIVKSWSLNSKSSYFILGFTLFTVANIIWIFSMKYELLSKIMIFYSVMGVVAGVLVGVFMFSEKLSTVNWIGFGFAVLSLILVNI